MREREGERTLSKLHLLHSLWTTFADAWLYVSLFMSSHIPSLEGMSAAIFQSSEKIFQSNHNRNMFK